LNRRLCWIYTFSIALIFSLVCPMARAVSWFPFGPDGGSARSFAADPKDPAHLYLGAANGWIYESRDGGRKWVRLARVGQRDDLVIDSIVVDSLNVRHLVVGAWVLNDLNHPDGGIFISSDGGATWTSQPEMRGQSVRALAASASNPHMVVAGTLEGVFRSSDSGAHWERISPRESREIHEVESLAIDPTNPDIIYAGTWHLPWKTIDGGKTWANIKQGIIEDSDVFSIILDPKHPLVVYASACSGIYKSEDGGAKFVKAPGIPSSARRTRVLMQDPNHLSTVFAGTTEGLYRTDDAGKFWTQTTSADVIVNDVYVDPADSRRVLLATDRQGILASDDGGDSFLPSNSGFSARQITAYAADHQHPSTIYVGVVNDKDAGGVFVSHTGGLSWTQLSGGLDGHDIFSLAQAPDGGMIAGTEHGMYRLKDATWQRMGDGLNLAAAIEPPIAEKKPANARRPVVAKARPAARIATKPETPKSFDASVFGFAVSGESLFAATSQGALRSLTSGTVWTPIPMIARDEWRYIASNKTVVALASLNELELSIDGGRIWHTVALPTKGMQLSAIAVDGDARLWVADRNGVSYSTDRGSSWHTLKDLFVRNVNSLLYDEVANRMLVTSSGPDTEAFAVAIPSMQLSWWDTGWNLRFIRPVGDHLVAATLFDGIVVQPRMIDSAEIAQH
jgi:photosystem II stability/assembly factor-like uncharacterized protein